MIKINLLPLGERKGTRRLKLPTINGGSKFLWMGAALVVFVGMLGGMATLQARKMSDLEQKVAVAKEEAQRLQPQLERIRKLTAEREEVRRRLNIIASLDRDRYYRVQLLNDISRQLPANCWLLSIKEQGPLSVAIEGITFSNYIVADLMNNLEKSERVRGISLDIAEEGQVKDHKVIQFSLRAQVNPR